MRHLLWAAGIAVPGLVGLAFAVADGNEAWAVLSGVVIGAGVGVVWVGWRAERDSDRRLAELVREYDARFHARENGGKVRR